MATQATSGNITFISGTGGGASKQILLGTPISCGDLLRQQGISDAQRVSVRLQNPGVEPLNLTNADANGTLVYPGATVIVSPKNVSGASR